MGSEEVILSILVADSFSLIAVSLWKSGSLEKSNLTGFASSVLLLRESSTPALAMDKELSSFTWTTSTFGVFVEIRYV